jgi:hypothetical protein
MGIFFAHGGQPSLITPEVGMEWSQLYPKPGDLRTTELLCRRMSCLGVLLIFESLINLGLEFSLGHRANESRC